MSATNSFLPWFNAAAGLYAGSLLFFFFSRKRTSRLLLICGFVPHTISLLLRGFNYGFFTPLNAFTEIYFLPWLLVLCTILERDGNERGSSSTLTIPICFLTAIAIAIPAPAITPSPQTSTVFATLFFLTEVTAHALFFLGGWHAILHLAGRNGTRALNSHTIWGFILFSIAQVTGAVWSWLGWTVPFHWSERHLVSAVIWCSYCGWLHLRFSPRWSARRQAIFVLCCAVLMFLFSYGYYLMNSGAKNV